ncbi:hypothetical protein [Roseomonas genomospecies 6]|uniref:C-lysozyme inhibitor n=1 Tax=Roseomonas genomospecies 6 TaxID=214106 RepID=A0A9W7NLF2_9PROT|nr:hypothetical protein [Roseomonas genomospecies 6]KAA0682205.1 hypothetical protein DS843_06575 [Roseomonas genomospecies 6]
MRSVIAAVTLIAATALSVQAADHAARALDREVYMVAKDPTVLDAVRKLMPAEAFAVWSKWAKNGVSAPMEERNGVVFGFGCQPGNCSTVHGRLAFDHDGRVWASLTEDGENTRYFGNPPEAVKPLLTVGTN